MNAPAYLAPVRDEIARLRAENERLERVLGVVTRIKDRLIDERDELKAENATLTDTLRRRTESHARLVQARLACPTCSTLPLEETPA